MFELENEIFVNGLASRRENVSMWMEMFRVCRMEITGGWMRMNAIPFWFVRRDLFAPRFDRLRTFAKADFMFSSSALEGMLRERENLNKVCAVNVSKDGVF